MKVTAFEILRVPPSWIWLKVHTDEGIVGLGEPYLESHPEAVVAELQRLEQLVVGRDPTRIEQLWQELYTSVFYYRGGPVTMSAISGIDMALWDIHGKALGVPIHRLLGGPVRDSILVYIGVSGDRPNPVPPGYAYGNHASFLPTGLATWDSGDWAASARSWKEFGFAAFKLHFTLPAHLESTRYVNGCAAILGAVIDEIGDSSRVMVDLSHPDARVAQQLVEALAPMRPLFIEDPQPLERIDVLRDIAARSSVAIAGGAGWMGKWDFADALDAGMTVVQPDLSHCGGITEAKKIAALAESHYGYIAPHAPSSVVQFAAALQVDAAVPNSLNQELAGSFLSRDDEGIKLGVGYLRDPLPVASDGTVAIPSLPGLGIALDDESIAELIRSRPWFPRHGYRGGPDDVLPKS